MDKTATDERCARCGCTPMEYHKLHCEGRDGNCMCHGGWREPGSMLTEVDRVAQAQNAEYDAEAADEDYFSDLTARLAAADQAWAENHDCPPAYPHYIRWLARQVDAFEDHASPAAPADDEAKVEPDETKDDGASWAMPADMSEIFQRVVAWSDSGDTGVGLVTWLTTAEMTSSEGRAIASRLVAAADYADALAALREGQS